MEAPSVSSRHLHELREKYPYASYKWNRASHRFELWCDEGRGHPPYMFMSLEGPEGQYREPGDWCIRELQHSDVHNALGVTTKHDREQWINSLLDQKQLDREKRDSVEIELAQLRNSARYVNGHGRNVSMDPTLGPKSYHMKRKLGG